MNAWAFTYNQKRLLQLLTTLSQNLENTMKYIYNKQDFFFFLAYDASHSFFTHATKKKQTKGLGYKQCSFWEKSSPVSSQHLTGAQQQEQAGLLQNAGGGAGSMGQGCGGAAVLSRARGMLTVDTGCAQT